MDISTLAGKIQLCYSTTELRRIEENVKVSTKEVAEMTGKRHGDVIQDTRNMLEKLSKLDDGFSGHLFEERLDSRGYTSEFLLDEYLAITLTSGYDVVIRYNIVKQWRKLRELVYQQQLLIEKQSEEKAEAISEKLKIAEEAENLAERRVAAAKDLMAVFKPGQLVKKVKDDPYWKQLCIETLEAFLKDPKLSTHYANEHDNAVKECVNVQDKLNDVLRYVKTFMTVKPNGIASRFPDCTEVLSYRRNLLR